MSATQGPAAQFTGTFPSVPMLDNSGYPTPGWRAFLLQLFNRTGGCQGADLAAGRLPAGVVAPTASPFAYTAPLPGVLYVSGGGVTAMTIRRGSVVAAVGQFYAGHKMWVGDIITVSYAVAPAMTFFPG